MMLAAIPIRRGANAKRRTALRVMRLPVGVGFDCIVATYHNALELGGTPWFSYPASMNEPLLIRQSSPSILTR